MRTALIFGGSGLIGGHLINEIDCSNYYSEWKQVGRKSNKNNSKNFYKINFDNLSKFKNILKADDVFCCLGSTIKSAGSKEKFYKIDYDLIVDVCRIVQEAGAKRLFLVSSIGADPAASNYYFQTKGKLELTVASIPFEVIHIFRPTLLIGKRDELRPIERLGGIILSGLKYWMIGPLKKLKPVNASIVAKKIFETASVTNKSLLNFNIHEISG